MRKFLAIVFLLVSSTTFAQVGINILIPDSSAVLQLESNKKGLGLSRLTLGQRDSIVKPLRGLTIYNTTDSFVEYWTGECWLRAYERNCNECDFSMSIDDPTDTLDRLVDDSVFSTITIKKFKSTHQVNVIYLAVPPPGVNIYFDGNTTIDTSGTIKIGVKADIFAGDGLVQIIVEAFCGDQVHFLSYNVYIEPCVRVTIPVDTKTYDLQAQNPIQLPPGAKKCVVLTVNNSVEVTADTSTVPAYTSGNLNPLSKVGIVNNGAFLGRGGDGAGFIYSGNLITVGGNKGSDGGNAINLTTKTIIINNGVIYGGGGGGGSVGFLLQTPSLPLVGSIAIGVGYGGGGGSELGQGGAVPNGSINFGSFNSGGDATAHVSSVPGLGATGNTTIPISISIVTVNLSPSAYGGDGGGYGDPGKQGYVDLAITVCIDIPLIGQVCIPIPIPGGLLPYYGPGGGFPGLAIKRNSNPLTGIPDGTYHNNQVKGTVGF